VVVAADVDGLALRAVQLGDDLRLVRGEVRGDRLEVRGELRVLRLARERLRSMARSPAGQAFLAGQARLGDMIEAAGADGAGPPSPPLGGPGADGDLDDEDLDALLQWSDALDFDAYHADWLGVATSARPDHRPSMMASA
jgi:hypothetical protein